MDPITAKLMSAAGGAAEDPIYVDDVFSTFLYDGTGSTLTINNGLDLSGEGGLVWIKGRTDAGSDSGWGGHINHMLFDTERTAGRALRTNGNDGDSNFGTADGGGNGLSITSTGFKVGYNGFDDLNYSGGEYCSWSFRKCPGFFDIVTYTGDANNGRTISHNLGSVPGSIWVKRLDQADNWTVYHRGTDSTAPEDYATFLNTTGARSDQDLFADTAPTASVFSVGDNVKVNGNGNTYVAYLFAHDDQSFGDDGDEAIIKCDKYTGNGTTSNEVNVGFEPQWLLIKTITASGHSWYIFDTMRGIVSGFNDASLLANSNNAEDASFSPVELTPTGFKLTHGSTNAVNGNNQDYIYIAIRRPHKPPSTGTDVFHADAGTNNSSGGVITTGFPVDFSMFGYRTDGGTYAVNSRLTGYPTSATATSGWGDQLTTSSTGVESTGSYPAYHSPDNTTIKRGGNGHNANGVSGFFFKRAPGFFDVVAWTGDGTSGRQIKHNLGVVPEMVVFKNRTSATLSNWVTYHKDLGIDTADHESKNMMLNSSTSAGGFGGLDIHSEQTSAHFTLRSNAASAGNYSSVKYLGLCFASLAGISKVGSYTGTGNNINVDCGFTAGARFVLIKRIDSSGDWYVFDSVRGIVSGNDPHLFLNRTYAEVTNTDYIDPLNAGFTVTSSAPAALNASGGTYMFLAIA